MFSTYIVWYLFFAGAGSGAYVVAALFSFFGRRTTRSDLREYRIISQGGFWLGPLLVAFGAVFLVFDLGSPEKAFTIFLTPRLTILGFGAWAVVLFCLMASASLFLHNAKQTYVPKPLLRIVEVLTLLAALSVMVYTGVLVSSIPAVPFLYTPLVIALFVVSSLTSGTALITLYGFFNQHRKSMRYGLRLVSRIDLALIILEVLALAAMLIVKYLELGTAQTSVSSMIRGETSLLFWIGVVFLGVILPVALDFVAKRSPQPVEVAIKAVSAVAVLVSAFALRYCLLASGLHVTAFLSG